jgi:hypothetical protein
LLRFLVATLLLVGCSHAPGGPSVSSSSSGAPIPDDLRPAIDRATRIGRQIFAQDRASSRATDVWLARVPEDRRRQGRGWVTLGGPPWKVAFLEGPSGAERVAFEVSFPADVEPGTGILTAVDPPRALEAEEALRRRMIRSAAAAVKASCGTPMNPVVLPPEGDDGWRVYFLNSTSRRGEMILGGHLRVRVSDDGGAALGVERLSQCLVQQQASVAAGTAALVVGTPLHDAPNEGHVFTAMSNGLPLYLATYKTPPGRVWLIAEDGTVTFDRTLPPH